MDSNSERVVYVDHVSLENGSVRLDSGETCEITNLLDVDGDETDDYRNAVSVVYKIPSGGWGAYLLPVSLQHDYDAGAADEGW